MSSEESPAVQFDDEEPAAGHSSGANGVGSEDEDDVQGGHRRRKTAPAEVVEEHTGLDDLFGEDEEDDAPETNKPAKRQMDDAELDSGDDEDRTDRIAEEEPEQFEEREIVTMDMEISRQAVPEPSDGEMYMLKVPSFMSIESQAWQTTTFQPPATDHHSKAPPTSAFSAYNTALTTIRWRHSPSDPTEVQSNARINRWSDGSLTLQLASDPITQYEVDGSTLAPPQRNPPKPTPTSIQGGQMVGRAEGQDAFTYLIVPVVDAEALRVAQKVTVGLSVKPTDLGEDEAIERLQAALASAANATKVGGASGVLEFTDFDPELQRKEAEIAERQQMRDRKKREHAQERERLRADRTLGRPANSSSRSAGGLNVGMLEDDEMGGGGPRAQAGKGRKQPRRRRNSEYSEDEDMGRKRFTKEDSYDQEDDFVAASDEEEEVVSDDDPDDGIVDERREKTPKRDRPRPGLSADNSGLGDDEDAEGEPDDDVPQARTKRRRVVDEDDDE